MRKSLNGSSVRLDLPLSVYVFCLCYSSLNCLSLSRKYQRELLSMFFVLIDRPMTSLFPRGM